MQMCAFQKSGKEFGHRWMDACMEQKKRCSGDDVAVCKEVWGAGGGGRYVFE